MCEGGDGVRVRVCVGVCDGQLLFNKGERGGGHCFSTSMKREREQYFSFITMINIALDNLHANNTVT